MRNMDGIGENCLSAVNLYVNVSVQIPKLKILIRMLHDIHEKTADIILDSINFLMGSLPSDIDISCNRTHIPPKEKRAAVMGITE